MMFRYSFDMAAEADAVENAVNAALEEGYRTADIMSDAAGLKNVSCSEIGDIIAAKI